MTSDLSMVSGVVLVWYVVGSGCNIPRSSNRNRRMRDGSPIRFARNVIQRRLQPRVWPFQLYLGYWTWPTWDRLILISVGAMSVTPEQLYVSTRTRNKRSAMYATPVNRPKRRHKHEIPSFLIPVCLVGWFRCNHRDNWIWCYRLVYEPGRQKCRGATRELTFKELPDGQIRSDACPLDRRCW